MNLPRLIHPWPADARTALALQQRLAAQVHVAVPVHPLRHVAGLDAAFSKVDRLVFAAVVLWDVNERRVLEQHAVSAPLTFPYVPGLLSFREAPALLAALRKLRRRPDALMCDGQGLAHPRRFGLACHLGLLTGLPSLGCAKSVLVGEFHEPGPEAGDWSELRHRDDFVGLALRTRPGVKPVFVSVGHLLDLPAAARLVMDCALGRRLPEPTRLADRLVAEFKREQLATGA